MGKAKILIGCGIAVALIAGAVALFGAAFYGDSGYAYTVVDNDKVQPIEPRGGMEFEYNLDAYDENGSHSPVSFQTSRELREGAYLKLETKPLRGVIAWEEVAFEDLPQPVQETLPNG